MAHLDLSQLDLLWKVYVAETPMVRLEKELTLSRRGVEHRVDACFKKLIRVLNDAKPRNVPGTGLGHPGARRAMSNARAQALTVSEGDNAVRAGWSNDWRGKL